MTHPRASPRERERERERERDGEVNQEVREREIVQYNWNHCEKFLRWCIHSA